MQQGFLRLALRSLLRLRFRLLGTRRRRRVKCDKRGHKQRSYPSPPAHARFPPLSAPDNTPARAHLNCGSTGMRSPLASRLVWLASPTTAISSISIASLMPFLRAAAVCE